ncbi:MAG: tape measure protein [Leuconostoc pseudomesenteroides]|uniref:tape measure protein n=1 Tax=Leuconostoc pseudomesenteroides TaxID=33968 RepID=UPI0039E9D250
MADISRNAANKVSLDTAEAVQSVKSLKAEIQSNTAAWKAQSATLKAAGDDLASIKSKYDGLAGTVDKQKALVSSLKSQMDEEAKSTSKNSEEYAKLERQYNNATTKLVSLTEQQNKAKQALDYQESGLAKLNDSLRQSSTVTDSYVKRLQAEGDEAGATKVKLSGLHDQQSKLNEIYQKQVQELDRLKSAEGDNAEAINRQTVRVNETAAKMARATSEAKDLREQFSKRASNSFLSGIASGFDNYNEKVQKAKERTERFKDIVGGTLIARGVYNAISQFSEQIKSVAENGMEAAKAGQEIAEKWSNLGISTDGVQKLAAQVALLKENSNLTGQAVANMQTRFYDQTHSVEETQKLTQGVASLADQLKMTQSQADGFSTGLAKIESAGKVTSTSLGRLEKQAPGLTTALQQASGMSQDAFSKLLSSGKMTANQFNDILSKAGNNFTENAKKFNETSDGASHHLQTVWADTQKKLMTPLVKVEATGLSSLSKALDNAQTQNAVNELGKGLANVAENLTKGVDYLVAHEKDIGSSVDSVYKITKYFGEGVWSVASGIIKGVSDAFGDLSGKSKGSDDILDNVASALKGIESHKSTIETVGKIAAGVWIAEKAFGVLNSTVGFVNTTLKTLDTVGSGIKWAASVLGIKSETKALQEQNAVLMENNALSAGGGSIGKIGKGVSAAETVAGDVASVGSRASGAGGALAKDAGMLSKLKSLTGAGKVAVGATGLLSVLGASTDLIGINSKNAGGKVGSFGGNLAGGAAGAAIGTAILPGIGTAIGAGIGSIGGDKIGEMLGKSIQKGLSKTKLKVPEISSKSSYDKLNQAAKKYYSDKQKQDTADIKLLYKNGDLTKAEYEKRLADIQKEGSQATKIEKLSQSDRTALTKYYAQQRAALETKWNKQKESDGAKWDKKIAQDAAKYGENSVQVQRDYKKKEQALAEDDRKKKSAINKLTVKDATSTTVAEAKLHTTLAGKIQLASDKQVSILTKLTKDKGKLSNKQLQDAVNDAQKEYKQTVSLADKKRDGIFKAALKQYDQVTKAAERQRKEVIKAANDQYDDTVKAANNQYKGNSKWAEEQRKAVIDKAKDQKDKATKSAWDQYNGVVDKAQKQQNDTDNAARTQHDKTIAHANDQKKQITDAARDQSHGVVSHAVKQANSSMEASSKQGGGLQGIWDGIAKFFNSLTKPFGVKGISTDGQKYNYQAMAMPAYSIGTGFNRASRALVGEAGVEARYQPYSGKIDFLGTNGAQVVNLNPGDQILNAKDTAKLFSGGLGKTMPGYAKGTTDITSFISSIAKGASNVWDDVSDAAKDALDKITDPAKTLEGIAEKAFNINSISGVGDVGHSVSKGMVDSSIKGIADFLSKMISGAKKSSSDSGGGKGAPSGSGVTRWTDQVKEALKANGLSTSSDMVNKVLRQIQTESGGNEKAVQGGYTDVNTLSGDLAKGLMQTISATFNAYAFPGHKNIFNGYDNLLAALAYAKNRYGSSLSYLGQGHGYANGGIATVPSIFGEDGPEIAIPLSQSKQPRAQELLSEATQRITGTSVTTDNSKVEALLTQNNQLMNTLSSLVGAILGETQKANEPLSTNDKNNIARSFLNRAGRLAN